MLSDVQATEHFQRHGVVEGRQSAPLGCREAFVDHIGNFGTVLEIGPFCNPLLRGENIRYLDVLTADQLRERARQIGLDTSGCPTEIHHVGDIAAIDETFDAVVSSHSIEHQPDLLGHFNHVARILRPGGCYFLIIPDKRYCFDHFLPGTTIADVLDAHRAARKTHSFRSVIEHWALITHNDPILHWAGDHGPSRTENQDQRIADATAYFDANPDAYIDVHAWHFRPENFADVMAALHDGGFTPLKLKALYPTTINTLEFFVILEK